MKDDFQTYKGQILDSIIRICEFESVLGASAGTGAPFGKNIADCLKAALDISSSLGFEVFNGNGYYGYADFGSGHEMLGILGHLDVVPPGDPEDWKTPPFKPEIKDGKLFARGVVDNKSPMILSMYALKSLIDEGFTPSKKIRFIFGTGEETSWKCIEKYKEEQAPPDIGFSPDACFPAVFAEKGILSCKLSCEKDSGVLISGGIANNVVPDKAVYKGADIDDLTGELEKSSFKYIRKDESLTVLGKAAHGSTPELGINAVIRLCQSLHRIGKKSSITDFISEVFVDYKPDPSVFGKYADESGVLTMTPSVIDVNKEKQSIVLDVRIPISVPFSEIEDDIIRIASKYGLNYSVNSKLDPLYVSRDSLLLKTLLNSYGKYSGTEDSLPKAIGGGTYARAFKNCVSFGPEFPYNEDVAHKPNEYLDIKDMEKMFYIYRDAIYELSK